MNRNRPFNIVFQILSNCPFACEICNRRNEIVERRMTQEERKRMISILREYGLKKLTVTGGEPTILGDELFDFLRYVHDQQIHISLSTSGYKLNEERIQDLNNYLDHLLISIRSLNIKDWLVDFGNTKHSLELFDTVISLLQWIKTTGIILEVSTVIHKHNINEILRLGSQLADINPNIIWRIEEYYAMGIRGNLRSQFELEESEFERIRYQINKKFNNCFMSIYFSKRQDRAQASDYFITPKGDLVTTSDYHYSKPIGNILENGIPSGFRMRRKWSDYEKNCRDWNW